MRIVTALPQHLPRTPFLVAEARAAGVGDGRLRGSYLEAPFRGVRRVRVLPDGPTPDPSSFAPRRAPATREPSSPAPQRAPATRDASSPVPQRAPAPRDPSSPSPQRAPAPRDPSSLTPQRAALASDLSRPEPRPLAARDWAADAAGRGERERGERERGERERGERERGERERRRRERFLADCGAFALLLRPGEVFCGVTAAELWDAPLATGFRDRVLHVAVRRPGRARRASGTAGHTIAEGADVDARRQGFPVSDAASTWLALAGVLPLNELVAVGDHLVHRPVFRELAEPDRPHVTLEELESRTREFVGPGAAVARAAIKLVVTGAESRPESLLRLLLNAARLPAPEVNPTVDDEQGRIGRFDLVYRPWKVIVEYDGDQHRTDDRQYERDMTRVERATHAGWTVVRVRKRGLFREPHDSVRRVESALRRAGWRRPERRARRASNRIDGTPTAPKERDGSS